MISIGVDPSLTRTAVACIHDDRSVTVMDYPTKGSKDATLRERGERIVGIARWVYEIVEGSAPGVWTIEGPSMNQRNAAAAHDRAGLWWLTVDYIGSAGLGLPIVVPPTVRAKYATGKGNAGKDEVLAAVVRRYPDVLVENNDHADALVLAAIGARLFGEPIDDLPRTHLAALDKINIAAVTA